MTAQIRSLESQITQLRALAPVQAAETTLTTRLSELADLEARANAPGLSTAQKAARANDAAMQQARLNARNAQQGVQEAYNAVDAAAANIPALRRFVVDPQLDNNLLVALADPNHANHAAAHAYALANRSAGLSINRSVYQEFLVGHSKEQFAQIRQTYGIRLIRAVSLEELGTTAGRLQRAFTDARVLTDPDARVLASAFLRNERIATNDLSLFKRARDLGLDVDYVGTGEAAVRAANYTPNPVTVPAN